MPSFDAPIVENFANTPSPANKANHPTTIRAVQQAVLEFPITAHSAILPENVYPLPLVASGVIVGTAIKQAGTTSIHIAPH